MNDVDDRLVGDPVWELFPHPASRPGPTARGARFYLQWLAVAGLAGVGWLVYPPLVVVMLCLAVALPDLCAGRRLARSIPDKGGGAACARFTYAWGVWKLGTVAFGLMFVTVGMVAGPGERRQLPPAFSIAMLLCMGGFTASAALTASGLIAAYRSGMRVWIGEGVNQARTLLLAMLIVTYSYGVICPLCLGLLVRPPRLNDAGGFDLPTLLVSYSILLGGPLLIVLVLDWIGRRVIADRPGKFGPKVPTVGKSNADPT